MSESTQPYKIRILKSWKTQDPGLVFQCQPFGPGDAGLPKKTLLFMDLRQQSFGPRFQTEKPADADANHAFIQILRKHIPVFTVRSIFQQAASGDYWLPLLSGPQTDSPWLLHLAASRPPLASLIAPDQTIFVSFGQKGTFTKKHNSESRPDFALMKDILPSLLQELSGASLESSQIEAESQLSDKPSPTLSKLQKDLIARLRRKLKTGRKTLEKTKSEIPSAEELQRKEREANLLKAYAWMIKSESYELRLEAAVTGLSEDFVISLDPELSVGQNMDKKFALWNKAKRGSELGQKHWNMARSLVDDLEKDLEILQTGPQSNVFLERLVLKYKLPSLQESSSTAAADTGSKPFKTYTSSTGHSILVGKSALDNDDLTRSARSNDFWFHAVGVTGSHVVVPVSPDIRQALPTQLLKEAAILALHFSRVRDDAAGECYVTRKQHLKKQRGMPAGLWRIDQSETVYFRYSAAELEQILQTVRM